MINPLFFSNIGTYIYPSVYTYDMKEQHLKDAENKKVDVIETDDGKFGLFVSGVYVGKKSKEWIDDLAKHLKESEVTIKII